LRLGNLPRALFETGRAGEERESVLRALMQPVRPAEEDPHL
jgi:hypothetical protein